MRDITDEDRLMVIYKAREIGFSYAPDNKMLCTVDQLVQFANAIIDTMNLISMQRGD